VQISSLNSFLNSTCAQSVIGCNTFRLYFVLICRVWDNIWWWWWWNQAKTVLCFSLSSL